MDTMDMYTTNLNCASKFISDNTETREKSVISFGADEKIFSSQSKDLNHSTKKNALKFDTSPDEFAKYMEQKFPEVENTCHREADNSKLVSKNEIIEITTKSIDANTVKNIITEMQTNNPLMNSNNINQQNKYPEAQLSSNSQGNLFSSNSNLVIDNNQNLANLTESNIKTRTTKNIFDIKEYIKQIYTFIYLDELRYYDEVLGYYRKLTKDDLGIMIYSIFDNDIARQINPCSDITSIYKALCLDPKIQKPNFINNQLFINCINGVIYMKNEPGLKNIEFYVHDSQYGFTNCINANFTNYNSIENTHFAFFLNSITNGNLQLQNLIREILGYILSNLYNAKKFFIFYGKSNSGKSLLLNLITHLVGEDYVSNVEMENLSDPKYTAQLSGKLLNVCSELPDRGISDTGIIKALVSENDKVSARQLYRDPVSFYNKAKLVFATNNLPEIKATSYKDNSAFFNRILIIPFLVSIPEDRQDKHLLQKLLLEKDIIFSWAIGGLRNYIDNGFQFSYSTLAQMYLDEYKKSGNNYIFFINSMCEICKGKYIFMDDLFHAYENFCYENVLDRPTAQDKKYLKKILLDTFNVAYKKLHRDGSNKWGFDGIRLVNYNS